MNQTISHTAPGWEERTLCPLPLLEQSLNGTGEPLVLRPGFVRLAALLEVTAYGGGAGLDVRLQHSPNGSRWLDLAAFDTVVQPGSQVAWLEAEPDAPPRVEAAGEFVLAPGTVSGGGIFSRLRAAWNLGGAVHTFGVDLVAIYRRRERS